MAESRKKIEVIEVVRQGTKFIMPEDPKITYRHAIDELTRREAADEQIITIREVIDCFPFDGAIALSKAIEELFGSVTMKTEKSFWGDKPPQMISVDVGVNKSILVPWGQFNLAGLDAAIATGAITKDGRTVFTLAANVKRKHEYMIRKIVDLVRLYSRDSIYRGKAFELSFRTEKRIFGGEVEEPEFRFLDIPKATAIFSKDLEDEIEDNVLTPIRYWDTLLAAGEKVKRGVLFAGPYGTGKTLLASIIANEGLEHGFSFVYASNVEDISKVLRFAVNLGHRVIVFFEDVERVAGMERTEEVNEILNILDGVTSKGSQIFVVMTTNHHDQINPAMRRKGRIDKFMLITPPDAEAAERLVRLYAGDSLPESEDLSAVGYTLAGQIPANITEVVKRARFAAIGRTKGESFQLTAEDILRTAKGYMREEALFTTTPQPTQAQIIGNGIGEGFGKYLRGPITELVKEALRTKTVEEGPHLN